MARRVASGADANVTFVKLMDPKDLPPEFLSAIKSRNLETTCNVRYGHHLSKCGLLANIAFRTGHRIQWDDERERIAGDNHASQYLARHFRKPWNVKTQRRPAEADQPHIT